MISQSLIASEDSTVEYFSLLPSPIEVVRKGRKREILHDHNDMYILHLRKLPSPSH